MKTWNTKKLTVTAMMTAILCVLAPFSIPIGDVPIAAGNFVIYIAAIILGSKLSTLAVALYLLIGMVGVPVFAGWKAGAGVLGGPTGGYLIGYLFIAIATGLFMELSHEKTWMTAIGMVVGTVICYAFGTVWLAYQLHLSADVALWKGVIPYIPGDIIKMIVTLLIAFPMKKQLKRVIG